MRKIERTSQFKRDYRREARSRHRISLDDSLRSILVALANDQPLEPRRHDHVLSGETLPFGTEALQSFFLRIGRHSIRRGELFLMSRDDWSVAQTKARFTGRPTLLSGANQAPASVFHETRNTRHETRLLCFPALYFLFLTASCCAQVQNGGTGMCTCQRTVNRSRWASRRAPFAGNPGKVYKIPLLTGKCVKRSVRHSSRFPPGWVPLRPTQNEPMLNKRNVLCCVDGAGRNLPLGPRALYIECGSGACQGSHDAWK